MVLTKIKNKIRIMKVMIKLQLLQRQETFIAIT